MDNILLCHEVVRGFVRSSHTPKALFKIDLQKAYDSVSWVFVEKVLHKMNFPTWFVKWIRECITTPKYSILVNGSPAGYFEGTRGLRQGDPMSPYIFCLIMEILTNMIEKEVAAGHIKLISKCKATQLSHLAFANDLMIFSKADAGSLTTINTVLTTFAMVSGLEVNWSNSIQIFVGVPDHVQASLCPITNFGVGHLPVRYLGVPLISGKLSKSDCAPILKRIRKRVVGWKTRPLSYAGCLTLIKSVMQSCYIYWSGCFGLPGETTKQIESLFARFLWAGQDMSRKLHAMSWEKICKPHNEGGLNLRRVKEMNMASTIKQIWWIVTYKPSLWVRWVHTKILKQESIWTIRPSLDCSWVWRRICQIREQMQPHVSHLLGNGQCTKLWLEPWHPGGVLIHIYGERLYHDADSRRDALVSTILVNEEW